MIVAFSILAVAVYFGFLIDWQDLGDILRQGGWGVAVVYGILAILIYGALASSAGVTAAGGTH